MSWFKRDSDQDKQAQIESDYRKVFMTSPEGQRVLTHILVNLGFFHEDGTDGSLMLQNEARRILKNCGVWKRENVMSIVKKLTEVENKL